MSAVGDHLRDIARRAHGWEVELHGHEMWGRRGPWSDAPHATVIQAYEDALACLEPMGITVAHSAFMTSTPVDMTAVPTGWDCSSSWRNWTRLEV